MGKNVNYKAIVIGTQQELEYEGISDNLTGQEVEVIYEFDDNYNICKTQNDIKYDIPNYLLKKYQHEKLFFIM